MGGVKALHSANVMHRDLKPDNCLVNADGTLKICDMGSGRAACDDPAAAGADFLTVVVMTQAYRAPEVLIQDVEKRVGEETVYGVKVDVWSIGCIMAEVITRKPLFLGRKGSLSQLEAIISVCGTPAPEKTAHLPNVSRYLASQPRKPAVPWEEVFKAHTDTLGQHELGCISKMLQFDPDERGSVTELLEHPFFEEWHDEDDEPEAEPFEFHPSVTPGALPDEREGRRCLWEAMLERHPEIRALAET
eukprot:NODE_539_length_885_cov_717.589713_g412_i0.p1 GENE.NODE_539_length_885_cov_717.589713_g412_i0~~NODE_539_length_885_cov_717.589713_g412_i0.p1  ORF type:complete len:247 (-),score=39.56 NODE_539_length_885_cov_717.589713_g412_i0:117-857(-)